MIDSNSSSLFFKSCLIREFYIFLYIFLILIIVPYIFVEIEACGIFNLILLEEIEIPFLVFLHNVY